MADQSIKPGFEDGAGDIWKKEHLIGAPDFWNKPENNMGGIIGGTCIGVAPHSYGGSAVLY